MIKHEKIAARIWRNLDGLSLYRLSEPVPYDGAIEKTWFVSIQNPCRWIDACDEYGNVLSVDDAIWYCFGATHAEALDALGYELIEEEK